MAPTQGYQKWLTLTGHSVASFSNAIGYGLYFTHLDIFSIYYNIKVDTLVNTFYIGLIFQIIFCIPAIKLVQWRLDYSIMCGAFLTMAGYWVQFTAQSNFIVVVCCQLLQTFGQAVLLPIGPYLAQRWFPLQQRSISISVSFYSNILGFAAGAVFTTLYVTQTRRISRQLFILSILSTFFFIIVTIITRNKPKILLQKYKVVSIKQVKQLWKYKYNTYSVIMASVFLGLSWSFLSGISTLSPYFSEQQIGILITIWITVGITFGIITSAMITSLITFSGNYLFFDRMIKSTLLFGLLGYLLMGICYQQRVKSFVIYAILMILIGIGSVGFYGFVFLSLVQSLYPLSSLLIGTLISVGASFYSALATATGQFVNINPFYIIVIVGILPFIYLTCVFQTNFKRYRHYLDQKNSRHVLLKVQDNRSVFQSSKKYQ